MNYTSKVRRTTRHESTSPFKPTAGKWSIVSMLLHCFRAERLPVLQGFVAIIPGTTRRSYWPPTGTSVRRSTRGPHVGRLSSYTSRRPWVTKWERQEKPEGG